MRDLKGKSLQRGLDIINRLLINKREMGVSDIAKEIDSTKGYTYDLLESLVAKSFVQKDPITKQYKLAPIFLALGNLALEQMLLPKIAMPYLQDLVNKTGYNASLAIPVLNQAVTAARVENPENFRVNINVGQSIPLHAGAISKVLLANADEETMDSVIREAGIENIAEFKSGLKQIKEQGFALSKQERIAMFMAVAVPVTDPKGTVIASLSIAGPISRMEKEDTESLIQLLAYCAGMISATLPEGGY